MKDTCVNFYNEKKPLCLKKDASGGGLGAVILLVEKGMNCSPSETPDNTILWPIAFASKSLYIT